MGKPAIQPRILKGFRDELPSTCIARLEMIRALEKVFSSYGFSPISTPALEYAEILTGKGSDETDKQMYRFEDNGGRDVALRFDLTVPLARFVAMHSNDLGTPFRRFHIAPVWRAEKPQRGRYREFIQCDFDIIGRRSPLADAEIISVIHTSLSALSVSHVIRLNNRNLLSGLLDDLGAAEFGTAVLRAIDKLEKLGKDTVTKELTSEAGLTTEAIDKVFSFLALSEAAKDAPSLLDSLESFFAGNTRALQGVAELREITNALLAMGTPQEAFRIDLSIARGLDYYTGTVFETQLTELPDIGSVCSGGRYDDLASLYTKQELPGVGGSIGLDRLLAALEELGKIEPRNSTASALVAIVSEDDALAAVALSGALREAGLAVEMYPEVKKLGAQIKFADRRGIPFVVFPESADGKQCSVKQLATGEQSDALSADAAAEHILKHS